MAKADFLDRDHKIMDEYYDLHERFNESNIKSTKTKLKKMIKKDPDFFDSYLFLYEILQHENNPEAETALDGAYERAIKLITDKKGNWPEKLAWGWLENRHIIRAIYNKAISEWQNGNNENALNLLRKLLKSNPNDNVGARDNILAIRMNMTYDEF